ncbi:unnamed protein product, partial [Lymnaea stagnalis]
MYNYFFFRSPPHPLISVLTNRPDAWPCIVEQTSALLKHKDKRLLSSVVEILRPFLLFVFTEPQQSPQYGDFRSGLCRALLDACLAGSDQLSADVIQQLLTIFPHVPTHTKEQVLKVGQMMTDVTAVLIKRLDAVNQRDEGCHEIEKVRSWAGDLLTYGLEVTLRCNDLDVAFGNLTEKLIRLASHQLITKTNCNLLLLSELLCINTAFFHPRLLTLAELVVKACRPDTYNVLCMAALVKPLLQLLALPMSSLGRSVAKHQALVKTKAGQLLSDVQGRLSDASVWDKLESSSSTLYMTPAGYKCDFIKELCSQLTKYQTDGGVKVSQESSCCAWLDNVSTTLDQAAACSRLMNSLVSAILVTARSVAVTQAALKVVGKISQVDPRQAPDFLPLLLYLLGKSVRPETKLLLLEGLPQLATHKICIPPILKTILVLGKSEELKPVSIKLLVALWKQQDRCFPQLLQAISEPQLGLSSSVPPNSLLLAKAAAILEICKHKPEQHGADLLAPLSEILNSSTTERDTAISVLALDGLYLLCEAEVIDLRSLWSVLGEKFIHENRPLVIRRVCRLLSLVPQLNVETEEYESFTAATVSSLWLYSQSSNRDISSAAYEALAEFNVKQFLISQLPLTVTGEFYRLAELEAQQKKDAGDEKVVDIDAMFPQVPGSCFVSILKSVNDEATITGYTKFLHSILSKEVTDLPRGIYSSSQRRHAIGSSQGKSIEIIPNFLLQQYLKCQQPGLRPGLAAGLLFCYDPPLEMGRDGRPRKHYVIRHGKTFLDIFGTLLQEVPVQPSEWHRFALMPEAWKSFMERLFLSLLESRKADLELQEKHGHISMFDVAEKKTVVWMAVRDAIMDVIKSASKGSPASQANSVMALAGLALFVHKFVVDLDKELLKAADANPEFVGHSLWLAMTFDTILCLMNPAYTPKGKLHGLCQQKSAQDRTPPSTLCSAVAHLAASQFVPLFTATDAEKIVLLLNTFAAALPNGTKPAESLVLVFCNGLALGMTLGHLFEEHFSEMTGSKGMLAVWKSLTALEEITLSFETENKTGCVLGLGLAICGMCSEGKTESRVHATVVLEKLTALWMNTPAEDAAYQALCVAVTSIAGSVFACNALGEETILPVVNKLKTVAQENPQASGVCLSLGFITYSLSKQGVQAMTPLRQEMMNHWLQAVTNTHTPPAEKVSKLSGLLAMIGSEQTLIPVRGSSMITGSDVNVSEVITMVTKIVSEHSDLGLQSVSAWMLGHLYQSACSAVTDNRTSVPSSYSYLPEWSILRALFDFLLEAGQSVPEANLIRQIQAALESLKVKSTLPPVNWAVMLSPFMRINYGDEIKTLCLQVASAQMQSSLSASLFISSWITPPLYSSLKPPTQAALHLCMPGLIKSTSASVLKLYLERSCLPAFTHNMARSLRLAVLQGLRDALAVNDPPEAVTFQLYETTSQLYQAITDDFDVPMLQAMGECLAQLPDDVMDSIIVADFSDATTQIKGSFIRCYLVAQGRQPISLLNYMIDASFNTNYWNHDMGMLLLSHCLVAYSKRRDDPSGPVARQQWFLELLGHTRTVVTGAMPLAETAPSKDKVISCVGNIVTAAVLAMTYPVNPDHVLWGFSDALLDSKQVKPEVEKTTSSREAQSQTQVPDLGNMFAFMKRYLPGIVNNLISKPWNATL